MTPPRVAFPDVEQDAVEYLRDLLAGMTDNEDLVDVDVQPKTPTARPARLVTIVRAGGPRQRLLERPRLSITCWHESDTQAFDLANLVASLVWGIGNYRGFRGVTSMTGPVSAPDTDGSSRYLLTVELTVKGAAA